MSTLTELKNFMTRGNVVDLAVGVIIGGAFGKIVSSLVSDVIMPPIGFLLNGVDFKDLKIVIQKATESATEVSINYGMFLQTILDFLIIATVIFFAIKAVTKLRAKKEQEPAAAPAPSKEEVLLTEIRDILKEK